jgi:hypothetical protein
LPALELSDPTLEQSEENNSEIAVDPCVYMEKATSTDRSVKIETIIDPGENCDKSNGGSNYESDGNKTELLTCVSNPQMGKSSMEDSFPAKGSQTPDVDTTFVNYDCPVINDVNTKWPE